MQAVKDLIKTRYSSLMWNSGLLSAWLKVRPARRDVVILNYHHVTPDVLADHLRALVRTYRVITLDQGCAYLNAEADVPPNSAVITFDDAYRQFHDELYPVLERFDVPATMFVPTASIDRQEVLWFNKVKALIHASKAETIRIGEAVLSLTADRHRAYHDAIARLNDHRLDDRDAILDVLFAEAELSARHLANHQPLTWRQIRRMHGRVSCGAHTVTHPNLSILNQAGVTDEVETSKRRIEDELGCEVRHFAYPFGRTSNISDDAVSAVRQAGFHCAVTTDRGTCTAGADPFALPRVVCDGIKNGAVLVTRLSDLWVCLST